MNQSPASSAIARLPGCSLSPFTSFGARFQAAENRLPAGPVIAVDVDKVIRRVSGLIFGSVGSRGSAGPDRGIPFESVAYRVRPIARFDLENLKNCGKNRFQFIDN